MSNVRGVLAPCTGAVCFSPKHSRNALRVTCCPSDQGKVFFDLRDTGVEKAAKRTCPKQAPNQDDRRCDDDKRTCDDLAGGDLHGLVSNGSGSVVTDLEVAPDNRDADARSRGASNALHAAVFNAVAVIPEVQSGNAEVSALFRAHGDLGYVAGF